MSDAMSWDIVLRVVNGTILLAIIAWPLLSTYRRIRYRLAHGVWPKKTREEKEMEEEQRKSSERFLEDADYHGNPFMPGSMAYESEQHRKDVEYMLEAGKSFDDR